MSYYKMLGMYKEPFSTSPDPDFLYESMEHKAALYRLRISIELRRGLCLVLGDVGTGKTTISRKLSQLISQERDMTMAMILNPIYDSEKQFLADLVERLHIKAPQDLSVLGYMKAVEKYLFEEGVERGKTVVLLVDECQKLADPSLEILRALLNYETNEYKILQLVMMGQMEFLPRISQMNNLWDRIAVKYVINPLDEEEVRQLIDFRLKMAGYLLQRPLFDAPAVRAVYEYTQGYPRKISKLCHDALEYLVMHGKERVDREIIESLVRRDLHAAHTAGYLTAVNG